MLFLLHQPNYGYTIFSQRLADELTKQGIESTCSPLGSEFLWRTIFKVFPYKLAYRIVGYFNRPIFWRKVLNKIKPGDVVVVYQSMLLVHPKDTLAFEISVKQRGGKYVFYLPDAWPLCGDFARIPCEQRVDAADLVLTVTHDLAKLMKEQFPNRPVAVVEEAIDTDLFTCCQLKDPVGHGGKTIVVWSGPPSKLDELQGLTGVLERVNSIHPFTLRIVSGSKRPKFDCNLEWGWLPFSAGYKGHFDQASIAIASYVDSPYGRCKGNYKIKTYMAAGCAIITSPVGYNLKLIQDGVNGLFASSDDEWEKKLLHLLKTPSEALRLGVQARKDASERYSYHAIANDLKRVLCKHFSSEMKNCRRSTIHEY